MDCRIGRCRRAAAAAAADCDDVGDDGDVGEVGEVGDLCGSAPLAMLFVRRLFGDASGNLGV